MVHRGLLKLTNSQAYKVILEKITKEDGWLSVVEACIKVASVRQMNPDFPVTSPVYMALEKLHTEKKFDKKKSAMTNKVFYRRIN